MTARPELIMYTFQMLDCYGDDFTYSVKAPTEKWARSIAEMACDDAATGKVLKRAKSIDCETQRDKDNGSHTNI